jgi:glucokinase
MDDSTARSDDLVVGIDIGGTKVALMATLRDSDHEVARHRFSTPEGIDAEGMVRLLRDEVGAMLRDAGREAEDLCAIGAAVPGQVNEEGHLLAAGNLGWSDFPFRARLNDVFGVPAFVEHDANAAALGELWRGHARAMQSFVFVALGTGIGAGLFLNGKLYRGAHHAAGELGDLIMGRRRLGETPDKARPLSDLIGSAAIRAKAQRVVKQELDAADTLRAAESDEKLQPLAAEVIDYIALTAITIITLLDPEAIIFGGGTSSAGDELIEHVGERVRGKVSVMPRLFRSALGEDAQLYGAIYGALSSLGPGFAARRRDE